MLEWLFAFILLFLVAFGMKNSALVKHHSANRGERENLVKRFNRLYKSRKELMGHFDWAIARKDEMKSIT